jgi:aminoglycoside phosphotransferase (APT) family kinase protein
VEETLYREEYGEVVAEEDFDHEKLRAYLSDKIPDAHLPMEVRQFRGGHSNLTYLLRFGEQEWVMRRPPLGPVPPTAHDMSREYRVLSALWRVYPPAPRAILFCDDAGVIGAPFYVMERRRGVVIRMRQPLPPELNTSAESLRRLSEAFIDALAQLHNVDYAAIGLGTLGRPQGFVERQISGWMTRWERAKTREVPLMNRLGEWFLAHVPAPQTSTVLHNDFFLHNVMFDYRNVSQVNAVLDWEMCTLGDPMVDLGITLAYWRESTDGEELLALAEGYPHTTLPGFLSRDQLAERYARHTGRHLDMLPYYIALAHWKTATVVEQIYSRYARGQTHDPRFANMGKQPPVLAQAAANVVRRLGFTG